MNRSGSVSPTGTLTIEPFQVPVPVAAGERLLDAILRAGHYVPFGCNHGGCGTCSARLVAGQVHQRPDTVQTLDTAAREQDRILLCSTQLCSDTATVDIADNDLTEEEFRGTTVHDVTTPIEQIDQIAPGLRLLRLTTPPPPWQPRPGQFVHLQLPDRSGWRAYSPASPPGTATTDLVIRTIPGGAFSTALDRLRAGDTIRCRGPFGTFTVRNSHRHKLFIGAGAGIGPIRAMVHDALAQRHNAPIDLVHVARTDAELAFSDDFHNVAATEERFGYHPRTHRDRQPTVRGAELATDWVDGVPAGQLRRAEAYLCGPDRFVDIVAERLINHGLRSRYLATDRFTASTGPTIDHSSQEQP